MACPIAPALPSSLTLHPGVSTSIEPEMVQLSQAPQEVCGTPTKHQLEVKRAELNDQISQLEVLETQAHDLNKLLLAACQAGPSALAWKANLPDVIEASVAPLLRGFASAPPLGWSTPEAALRAQLSAILTSVRDAEANKT